MSKFASMSRFVLAAVVLAAMAATPVAAAEPAPEGKAAEAETEPDDNLECHDEAVSGKGPGFTSSPERSEQEAIDNWLAKAREVYTDATWETAKDKKLGCARQGLYSKCFIDAVPCHKRPEG